MDAALPFACLVAPHDAPPSALDVGSVAGQWLPARLVPFFLTLAGCGGQAKQEKLQSNFNTRQVEKISGEVLAKQDDEDDQ